VSQGGRRRPPLDLAKLDFRGGFERPSPAYDPSTMDINLNLGLVNAQFDESNVALDAENNVSGVLSLTGIVDADWRAAFEQSGPPDAPWTLEDGQALGFGPIPVRELAAYLGTLRSQINKANERVQPDRHERAMAEYLEAEERARAYSQAIEALSSLFGRRLSTLESAPQAA
jgi:hypothetical protein